MHGGKSEGVTHESMCHHHLILHQIEWEKNWVEEIEKERKERKEGEGKRKGMCAWGEERKPEQERKKTNRNREKRKT